MSEISCGDCGSPMVLRETTKFRGHGGKPRKFYGCSQYPACRGIHGAHQETGAPLGIPASAEVRLARKAAHEVFDLLWQEGHLTRRRAYEWMREAMGLEESAHIANLDLAQCKRLVELASDERSRLEDLESNDPDADEGSVWFELGHPSNFGDD